MPVTTNDTTALTPLDASIAAFQAVNAHIQTGCTTCTPAARLPQMCPDGQSLALAAVDSLAADHLAPAHNRKQDHPMTTYTVPALTRAEVGSIRDRDPRPANCPQCTAGTPVDHWPSPAGCRSSFRDDTGRLFRVHCTCGSCW